MLINNKNCSCVFKDINGNKVIDLTYETGSQVYDIVCKLNQYPTNLKLFRLLTYGEWKRSFVLENAASVSNLEDLMKLKKDSMDGKNTQLVKFSRSPDNADYLDPETDFLKPEERLFNYIGAEIIGTDIRLTGDISLINADIRINIKPIDNKITIYLSLDSSKQDMYNEELYRYILGLPNNPFGLSGLVTLVLESSGIEIEFFDIIRNYIPDEFLASVLKNLTYGI